MPPTPCVEHERRLMRVEQVTDALPREREDCRKEIWKEINGMKIEAAKQQVKVALLVGMCSAFLTIVAQIAMQVLSKH